MVSKRTFGWVAVLSLCYYFLTEVLALFERLTTLIALRIG